MIDRRHAELAAEAAAAICVILGKLFELSRASAPDPAAVAYKLDELALLESCLEVYLGDCPLQLEGFPLVNVVLFEGDKKPLANKRAAPPARLVQIVSRWLSGQLVCVRRTGKVHLVSYDEAMKAAAEPFLGATIWPPGAEPTLCATSASTREKAILVELEHREKAIDPTDAAALYKLATWAKAERVDFDSRSELLGKVLEAKRDHSGALEQLASVDFRKAFAVERKPRVLENMPAAIDWLRRCDLDLERSALDSATLEGPEPAAAAVVPTTADDDDDFGWRDKALAIAMREPELNKKQIAERCRIPRGYLSDLKRAPMFVRWWALRRRLKADLPRGTKTPDGRVDGWKNE